MDSELVQQFVDGARAIAPFTSDEDRFRALFDAFRAFDRDSYRRLLAEADVSERCEEVCGWLCSKDCVLLCLELCGPPPEQLPGLAEFAAVAVRISSNEELVERLASAVSDRNPEAFRALVDELEIGPFCHLLCHWACIVRCELVCRVLCSPEPVSSGLRDLAEALTASGQAISRLLDNKEALAEVAAAAEILDCERLRAAISSAGLTGEQCRLICRWICAWRCLWVCLRLCPAPPPGTAAPGLSEAFQFAQVAARLAESAADVERLVAAAEASPPEPGPWRDLLDELKLTPYCIQLCHWICELLCSRFCICVCPPPPIITEVGLIPTNQIDAAGQAAGPSLPSGTTPNDDTALGVGDHPYGGTTNIRGVFNIAGATQYKVEYATSPGGPWTAITTTLTDIELISVPPWITKYTRAPVTGPWYDIADMSPLDPDYLTDWLTSAVPDGLYYLKLTVRNAALTEFASPLVPVCVDNTIPTGPLAGGVPQITIQQGGKELGCCETVRQKGGDLSVTIVGWDVNFGILNVEVYGSCGVSTTIYTKAYNGNTADTGAPAPGITFSWDPWTAGIEPCCYVVFFKIWDRAVVDNFWNGGHGNENWMAITIA